MFKKLAATAFALFILSISNVFTTAQNRNRRDDRKCPQPVYAPDEVTRRARIVERADFSGVMEVFLNVKGRVKLDAVLCRSGQVTDISVTESSVPSVNEFIVGAISMVSFVPAELNLHSVSQKIQFEFEIQHGGIKEINLMPATKRLVESVNVLGNRRFTAKEIFGWIKTRAGEPYDEVQLKRDFDAVLRTGQFDKLSTRVFIEDGVRGGVGVYFEVHELPVVGVVSFEGLKIDPAVIRKAWKDAHIDLETGNPYWDTAGKAAIRIIKQLLDANALDYSAVDLRAEFSTSQTVNLVFVIKTQ